MNSFLRSFCQLLILSLFISTTSCGGGGGSSDGPPPSGQPVNASRTIELVGVEGEGPEAITQVLFEEGFTSPVIDIAISSDQVPWMNVVSDLDAATDELRVTATPVFTDGPGKKNIANFPAFQKNTGTTEITYTRENGESDKLLFTFNYTPMPALLVPDKIVLKIDTVDNLNDILSQSFTVSNNRKQKQALNWAASLNIFNRKLFNIGKLNGDTDLNNAQVISNNSTETQNLFSGKYTATLKFTSTSPIVSDVDVPIELIIVKPRVSFVSPYVAEVNTQNEVIIRGSGFSLVNSPSITFTDVLGVKEVLGLNINVISDSEIRITHPNLSLGSYDVNLKGTITPPTTAKLVVVAPPNFSYAAVSDTSNPRQSKSRVIYDAERRRVYAFSSESSIPQGTSAGVYWYEFNNNVWSSTKVSRGVSLKDFDMSPNGEYFYFFDNFGEFRHYNIANFQNSNTLVYTSSKASANNDGPFALAFTNEGSVLSVHEFQSFATYLSKRRFDSLSRRSIGIDKTNQADVFGLETSKIRFSADGQRGIVTYDTSTQTVPPIEKYDASSNTLVDTNLLLKVQSLSLDRTGSKAIINKAVYDSLFQAIGKLPASTSASIISHDGKWAYTCETSVSGDLVRKFDLSSVALSGNFNEVGTATVLADSAGNNSLMTISPDGRNLFIVGDNGLLVVPSP